MKLFKNIIVILALLFSTQWAAAQSKTETVSVSGNCGMCRSTIEKAAKSGGAKTASWNTKDQVLTVQFDAKNTNLAKIQQSVADAGYDTRDIRGNDAAYQRLHECCQYDREKTSSQASKK